MVVAQLKNCGSGIRGFVDPQESEIGRGVLFNFANKVFPVPQRTQDRNTSLAVYKELYRVSYPMEYETHRKSLREAGKFRLGKGDAAICLGWTDGGNTPVAIEMMKRT